MKDVKALLCGSPLILTQLTVVLLFLLYGTGEAQDQYGQPYSSIYALLLLLIYTLAMTAMFQTFLTHPGQVNKLLIDKLKS